MSEEGLERIESRLAAVEGQVAGLRIEMHQLSDGLRTEMHQLNDGLRTEMHQLNAELRTEMHQLNKELRVEMHRLHDDLKGHMGVLFEDAVDRIKALAPDFEPVRREFKAADAELRDEFDRRLVPLEAHARGRSKRRPR